jgi:cyclin E
VQAVAISCLFVAAKLTEIYPPPLARFADLTDGACTEAQLLATELAVTAALRWRLSPVTPLAWLELFLQAAASPLPLPGGEAWRGGPGHYSPGWLVRAARLLDLAVLDVRALHFAGDLLAAAVLLALEPTLGPRVAALTGYSRAALAPCLRWLAPFAATVAECPVPRPPVWQRRVRGSMTAARDGRSWTAL